MRRCRGALLFPAVATAHTDAGWQLSLEWPADGATTSPFGQDGYRCHPGLDIGILRSLDVRAVPSKSPACSAGHDDFRRCPVAQGSRVGSARLLG
jgi:hypothetical protein